MPESINKTADRLRVTSFCPGCLAGIASKLEAFKAESDERVRVGTFAIIAAQAAPRFPTPKCCGCSTHGEVTESDQALTDINPRSPCRRTDSKDSPHAAPRSRP